MVPDVRYHRMSANFHSRRYTTLHAAVVCGSVQVYAVLAPKQGLQFYVLLLLPRCEKAWFAVPYMFGYRLNQLQVFIFQLPVRLT